MKRVKQLVVIVFAGIAIALCASGAGWAAFQAKPTTPAKPSTPATPAPGGETAPAEAGKGKYNLPFDHFAKVEQGKARQAHSNLTAGENCEVCHERLDDNPTPVVPYHDSCVRCHANQFTDTKLEICADCHSRPYNEKPQVTAFPKQLNQFGLEFSHASHKARADFKCETCHLAPADNKTSKATYPDHPECYTCHKSVNLPAKGNCNECHKTGASAERFKDRGQVNFAHDYFNFNHGVHMAVGRTCEECHDVLTSDNDPNKKDVSRITLILSKDPNKFHKAKCFDCHNKTGNDEAGKPLCLKCHIKEKVPGDLVERPPKEYFGNK